MSRHSERDEGMTLVEIIIVTALLGLVASVIAAAVITVLKVTPEAAFRVDDARSTRGLQTWLVRDVASTPPNMMSLTEPEGYVFAGTDPSTVGAVLCGGTPASMVLHMGWSEETDLYFTTYHIAGDRITRSECGTETGDLRLATNVSSLPCASLPFAQAGPETDVPADLTTIDSVEICLRGVEADTGLNSGGGDVREIRLTVSSRNRAT